MSFSDCFLTKGNRERLQRALQLGAVKTHKVRIVL